MFNGVDDSDGIPSCTVLDAHITSDCLLLFEVAKVHRKWTDMVFDGWNPALICDVKNHSSVVMKTIIRIETRGPKLFNASSRNLRIIGILLD